MTTPLVVLWGFLTWLAISRGAHVCVWECVYLQWHSCCTEPGQVVGSPAGSRTRLLAFLSFSHICLGCCCSWSYLSLSVPFSEAVDFTGSYRSLAVACKAKLHLDTVCPLTQNSVACCSACWRNLISKTIIHCASCEQLIREPITGSISGPGHVWLGQCTVADSALHDPQQMWGPITLQTVISGSRSSLHCVARSQCWNGLEKSSLCFCFSETLKDTDAQMYTTNPECRKPVEHSSLPYAAFFPDFLYIYLNKMHVWRKYSYWYYYIDSNHLPTCCSNSRCSVCCHVLQGIRCWPVI